MRKVDPVTLEVMRNTLYSITDEMSAALVRTAYSTNIKDRRDCSCALYTSDGRVVAQSEIGTPLHLGVMPKVIKSILQKFNTAQMDPGDHFILNTPYPSGPGHLNDITIMHAIHCNGRVIALVANQAHHVDVGGYAPGSMPFGITEIFQEGIQIPASKIMSHGEIIIDVFELIKSNVRTKDEFSGDIMAQISANNVGRKRFLEVIKKYSLEEVSFYMDEIMNYSERRMRSGIRLLPQGEYEFEDYLEGTGISDEIINIRAKIMIQKSSINVDFSGTHPQVKGPINCKLPTVEACVYYVMKCIIDPGLPPNDGAYRSINLKVPEGCLLNAEFPASVVQSNIITTQRIVDVLLGAMFKAVPEKVCAACSGTESIVIIGGLNPKTNSYYNYVETYGGGQGATYCQDGMSGVHTHMTNTRNAPVEVIENNYPLFVEKYGLVPNSEGAGKYRGGFGMTREVVAFLDSKLTVGTDREKLRPWGVLGGHEASGSKTFKVLPDGKVVQLPAKFTGELDKQSKLIVITPGGGGWGDPFTRDPEKVLWDVVEGLVSINRARDVYGVIINPHKMEVNLGATKELRNKKSTVNFS